MTEWKFEPLRIGEKVLFKTDITAAVKAGIHEDFARRFAGKSVTIKKLMEGYIQIEESIISWWFPVEFIERAEEKRAI